MSHNIRNIINLKISSVVDDPQSADVNEDEGWEFMNLGEQQKFGIKTAGLEDKSTACQMLVHYARELKEGFVDYTEQVNSSSVTEFMLLVTQSSLSSTLVT